MTDAPEIEIDIASDVVCPWCVVGWLQLERALAETGVAGRVRWHPFELNPDMPEDGENLREHLHRKYGTPTQGSWANRERLTAMGAELGFAFDYHDEMRMVNTARAHRLLHWADGQGAKHRLKMALFRAHFSERRDVNDVETLVAVAASEGLDADEAAAVLQEGRFADEVREHERFWMEAGVGGVPAMVFARRHLVTGAQGVDAYARILRHLTSPDAA
jgi:predicted DsbA family dithiol-disulfide isomerase